MAYMGVWGGGVNLVTPGGLHYYNYTNLLTDCCVLAATQRQIVALQRRVYIARARV